MATYSSILAWRILWTEKPGRFSPWGCRVGHAEWQTLNHSGRRCVFPRAAVNEGPPARWPDQQCDCLSVLDARSLTSRGPQGWFFMRTVRQRLCPALPWLLPAPGGPWLVAAQLQPLLQIHVCVSCVCLPTVSSFCVRVCISLTFLGHQSLWIRAHPPNLILSCCVKTISKSDHMGVRTSSCPFTETQFNL